MCPIRESTVYDDESNEGEDAIFCDGECQIWLHRKCVGLTKNAFRLIGKSKEPSNNHCKKVISEPKELVKYLSNKLSCLENQISQTYSALGADSASNQV